MHLNQEQKSQILSLYHENLDTLRKLAVIPSPSRKEDERASFCLNWMKSNGISQAYIDSQKNAIGLINCSETNPVIVFSAHTDVVFADETPLPLSEDEEKIHCPGVGDDTGNLINMLLAVRFILSFTPLRNLGIVLVAGSCEEGLGNLDGTKQIIKTFSSRIKAFISFDGYQGACCSKAVGSHRYELTVSTKGGHSYNDFGEPSAIKIAADLIEDLYAQALPDESKTTLNVGTITGGTTINSIPSKASLLYEYRSESDHCLNFMSQSLKAILDEFQARGQFITSKLIGIRPGSAVTDLSLLEKLTSSNSVIVSEFTDHLDLSARSTDSNIPLSRGIPANTIGTVVGLGAHTRDEWLLKEGQKNGMLIAAEVMISVISIFSN